MRKSTAKLVDGENKTMAERLGLGPEVKELKLGQSFTNNKSSSFHTLRYDFKPASVDMTKVATVAVGEKQQVTVTVPHMDGAGTSQTIFKGSHRPYQKECVLIFDRNTGEVTLEKLTSNLQVKKTRAEPMHNKLPHFPPSATHLKPSTSKDSSRSSSNSQKKTSTHPKSQSGARAQQMASSLSTVIPRHSPLHASPSYPQRKSPQMPVAPSLPVIGAIDAVKTVASPSDIRRPPDYLGDDETVNFSRVISHVVHLSLNHLIAHLLAQMWNPTENLLKVHHLPMIIKVQLMAGTHQWQNCYVKTFNFLNQDQMIDEFCATCNSQFSTAYENIANAKPQFCKQTVLVPLI